MLPLFVFCIRWGFGRGLLVCTAFGLLQVFVQGAVSYGWISILLDYIVAFMPLCLCGLGKGKPGGLFWGSVLGSVGRFVIHFISGITVYRILEPTGLMGMTFSNPYLYSAVYNGSYVLIDLVLCLVILAVLSTPMRKYLRGDDLKAMRGE